MRGHPDRAPVQSPDPQRRYELAWHLGASQGDLAGLNAEDIDWREKVISYQRLKTGSVALLHFGDQAAEILRALPRTGPLFPCLRRVRASDRATEFKQRCASLGIVLKGTTTYTAKVTDTALGTMRSVEHTIQHLDELGQSLERDMADGRKRLADTQGQVDTPFEYAERLAELVRRQDEIENDLDLTKNQIPGQVEAEQPDPAAGIEDAWASARVTA